MITAEQIKAGRALIGWSQADLAKKSGYSLPAINNIERNVTTPRTSTLKTIQQALEEGGIEFTEGPGVRLQSEILNIKMLEGKDSLRKLFADIYETMEEEGGLILVSSVDEKKFIKADKESLYEYVAKCRKHGKLRHRILHQENDTQFLGAEDNADRRWIKSDVFGLVPMYIYGDKHAVVLWGSPLRVVLVHNSSMTETYRRQFNANWKIATIPNHSSK